MKLGIVIYSDHAESVWNAFRLGNFALKAGDTVKTFLLAKGVDSEKIGTSQFKVMEEMQAFADAGGEVLACGTCLEIRNSSGSEICPLSTMQDLYDLISESDKIVSI